MEIMQLILPFLFTIIVGWNILFWIIRRDCSFSIFEKIALSYIIGLALLTLQMFLYSLADIKFSISLLLLPHLFITIVNGFVFAHAPVPINIGEEKGAMAVLRQAQDGSKDGEQSRTMKPWGSTNTVAIGNKSQVAKNERFDVFLMAGILFQVFHVFFKALIKPMDSFDSIGNFAFKAKMFFIKGYIPYELFLNKSIDIQHTDYPLFIPLSETWVYMFLGDWNDLLAKALFSMFFVCLLTIFYFALRRIIGKRLSLVSTFFLATIPHFLNYATIGYADFALAMFYSASFLYIFLWISYRRESKYLILAAILSFFAVWTKHEGAMLSLVNLAALYLFVFLSRKKIAKNEIRAIVYFSLIVFSLSIMWFSFLDKAGLSNEFINKETLRPSVLIKNLDRISLVLYDYQRHIFGPKKWNISLLVFFAGLILYFKRTFSSYFKYITISILLAFAGYTAFYLLTPLEIRYHLQTSGSRILLHFLPIVVLWIGYLAKEILNAESNIHR